jgi:hypothetical protein
MSKLACDALKLVGLNLRPSHFLVDCLKHRVVIITFAASSEVCDV